MQSQNLMYLFNVYYVLDFTNCMMTINHFSLRGYINPPLMERGQITVFRTQVLKTSEIWIFGGNECEKFTIHVPSTGSWVWGFHK